MNIEPKDKKALEKYYNSCPFPKPKETKKKPLMNGYKDKANRVCIYCGSHYAERHELFGGPNRQLSIKYGLQVDVCPDHHRWLQENKDEEAVEENQRLRAEAQMNFIADMVEKGYTADEALRLWMSAIGKNYCKELQPK